MENLKARRIGQFKLRHSPWPTLLFLLIFAFLLYGAFQLQELREWTLALVLIIGAFSFLDIRQGISYHDGTITWNHLPKAAVSITLSDIADIKRETKFWRSSTRDSIVIRDHANKHLLKGSLTLFVDDDIRKLMRAIHEERPDLAIPDGLI